MKQSANSSRMAGSRSSAAASRSRNGTAGAGLAGAGNGEACSRRAYPAMHATADSGTSGSAGLSPRAASHRPSPCATTTNPSEPKSRVRA